MTAKERMDFVYKVRRARDCDLYTMEETTECALSEGWGGSKEDLKEELGIIRMEIDSRTLWYE